MSKGDAARSVEVDLEVSSWIEGRGVRHTNWAVRLNAAWVPVAELAGVVATIADPDIELSDEVDEFLVLPPGCQYRKTYHPRLPVGTRVLRRVSAPRVERRTSTAAPATASEALSRLTKSFPPPKQPLKTTVTELRVAGHGKLVSELEWQERSAEARSRKPLVRPVPVMSEASEKPSKTAG